MTARLHQLAAPIPVLAGTRRIVALLPLTALCLLPLSPRSHAQIPEGWEIVEITNTPILFDGWPDINERGQIVFTGAIGSSLSDREIFVYDRGRLYRITDDDVFDGQPSLNNNGEIAWERDLHRDGALGIVKWHDGSMETISDQPFFESASDINDAGDIVWQGIDDPPPNEADIFFFDGVSRQTIIDDAFAHQVPRINNNEQVIWTRCDFVGNESDIMLYDDGIIRPLSHAETACALADMNDAFQVVWLDAQSRLQMWDDGVISQVTTNLSGPPSINNDGTVVFPRWDSIQQIHSIWMVDEDGERRVTDGPTHRVPVGVNSRGEIVFGWGPFLRDVGVITNPIFRAEADFDGDVDLRDFALVQNCWNVSTTFGSACSEADLNVNDLVETKDLQILLDLITGPIEHP